MCTMLATLDEATVGARGLMSRRSTLTAALAFAQPWSAVQRAAWAAVYLRGTCA